MQEAMTIPSRHFYLRDHGGRPIGAMAVHRDADGWFVAAASLCSRGDDWSRTEATAKAKGRLQSPSQRVRMTGRVSATSVLRILFRSCSRVGDVDTARADSTLQHLWNRMVA
jgi:hypothetical protein